MANHPESDNALQALMFVATEVSSIRRQREDAPCLIECYDDTDEGTSAVRLLEDTIQTTTEISRTDRDYALATRRCGRLGCYVGCTVATDRDGFLQRKEGITPIVHSDLSI